MPDNSSDKVVSIFLKFGADAQSVQKAIEGFKRIEGEIAGLETEAKKLKSQISASLEHGEDASGLSGDLKTVEAAISNLRARADKEIGQGLTTSFDKAAQAAKQTGAGFGQSFNLRDIGEKINYVGMAMQNAGRTITTSLLGAVNAYMNASGQYSSESRRWQAAQNEMQRAYERIGAVALEKLTPYIEKAADLVTKLADLIEKNPWLVEAVAGTGAVLTLGGQMVSGLASVAMIAGSFQGLSKILGGGALSKIGSMVGGAAGGVGRTIGTAVASTGGAIVGGVLAGGWAYNALANSQMGQRAGLANLGQYASVAAYGAGKLFDEATAQRWFLAMGRMTGVIQEQADAADKYSSTDLVKNGLQDFIDYQKQAAEAAAQYGEQVTQVERDTEKQRLSIIQSFAQQAAQAERQYATESARAQREYQSQTAKAAAAFAMQEAQAEREYYKARAEAARNYGQEAARMEQDHQREMLRMQEDHNSRVSDLVAARDALGLIKENQAYERDRGRAEQDYSTEAGRKKADYAQQMADMERNFAEQRANRRADFARQIAEAREQFAAQQAERAAQHAEQMAQMKANEKEQLEALQKSKNEQLLKLREAYNKQTDMMQKAFIDRLNVMSQTVAGSTVKWTEYMKKTATDFEAFLAAHGYAPNRATGGPVTAGQPYIVGEHGPEMFVPRESGRILPTGMTHALMSGGAGAQMAGGRAVNLRVETQSLTLSQVLAEVDRRFAAYDRGLAASFGDL